jgi:phosphoglycolate phosphatase-like HAD superfamily hydrolase
MTVTPSISAILLDTDGVLYHRPRGQAGWSHSWRRTDTPPATILWVERAMRAARTDVQSARITREVFYDALLRVHGVSGPELLERGRAALLEDAADIELFPGVGETLERLQAAGYRLGTVSFTDILPGPRFSPGWPSVASRPALTVFLASPDYGHVTTPGGLNARGHCISSA